MIARDWKKLAQFYSEKKIQSLGMLKAIYVTDPEGNIIEIQNVQG